MGDMYEVILDGGGPWGIRLQGGKDFGVPLNVARVTSGSKAGNKNILAGDSIVEINNVNTDSLTHMEAQNLIKNAGQRLQLRLKQGKGVSLGEQKQVGSGGFAPAPQQTLYQTNVVHSAGVDHKYNSKPKAFTSANSSATTVTAKRFDPAEYAKRKKEELEKYKEEQSKPAASDSDVLKMLQKSSISDGEPHSFSRLQDQLSNEGKWADQEKSFRMTTEGTDLSDVSPGSRQVMEDIRNRNGSAGLNSNSKARPSGGSKAFRYLQEMTDQEEDLPPPPPELMGDSGLNAGRVSGIQSGTFNRLQAHVDAGTGDQIDTVFGRPAGQRNQAVPAAPHVTVNTNRSSATVNVTPKAPMPTGPNFKVGRPTAPTFKQPPSTYEQPRAPPPPAVNAGEVVNPNSRSLSSGSYPQSPTSSSAYSPPGFSSPSGHPPPPPPAGGSANVIKTKGAPAPVASANDKDLVCNACHQQLTGPFVSAIGKTWHPDHFCCSACNVSLQNQAFVEESNQLFCEKCYNSYYAPKCAHCNNAIIGNCINALGKSWHPDHFVCAFCNRGFGNDGFLVDSGKPYCEKCFEDLFSVKCGKCARPITGGEKYVEALNKNWHSDCFSCTTCNIRLEGNSFFVSRGMPYCAAHKAGH